LKFRGTGRNADVTPTATGSDVAFSATALHTSGGHPPALGAGGPRRSALSYGRRAFAVLVVLAIIAVVLALVFVRASVGSSSTALATVGKPLSGGTIVSVSAVTGPHARPVPVRLEGQKIWPRGLLPVGERVSIEAVVKRPSWISWLTGSTERVSMTLVTPSASLRDHFLTLARGAPVRLQFDRAVATISTGQPGQVRRRALPSPRYQVTLPRTAPAGSMLVAATPRTWESAPTSSISWFPPGSAAAAVASPAPGSRIQPDTAISLTFSQPVAKVLGRLRPVLTPATSGRWQTAGAHTLVFHPSGGGYGLDAKVTLALPNGVTLVGAQQDASADTASWTVPQGSTLRLQQLLSQLGYLPFRFIERGSQVPLAPLAQEAAAVDPPTGRFSWRYGSVPAALRALWQPGTYGELTRGAVMAFENEHEMTADGEPGPAVWRALISDAVAHRYYSFGYTFVDVSEASETLNLWHDGRTALTTPVNTGIPGAPTETGTFAVYEHIASGTMSGTNPDGTHYKDPGIPWISYFNGGDALHGFIRASYGFPQSLGCVEMPPATAGEVWPYTPIGTIVHIH
jgi:peptidoglycan hydrolase-like protein with peptidoglycan-binding domain